jgi:thioredoxin 1
MDVKIIGLDEFDGAINEKDKVVLVDFYADWCGPCKMLAPVIHEIAEENVDKVSVYKVNIDESMELSERYKVMNIPTIIAFKDGEVIAKEIGIKPKEVYEGIIGK